MPKTPKPLPKPQQPASALPRAVWKGSVQFGLVHVPVALYAATAEQPVDFDWLDKRTMDPVGTQRINKTTGEVVEPENVVKGVMVAPGQYVVVTEEEIAAAAPKATKTIALESFVANSEIPFVYLGRAYYMLPINQGEAVYALLCETLLQAGKVGLARLVMHGREHLAAVVPTTNGLMLNLLRWPDDIRPWAEVDAPLANANESLGISTRERAMARQLVDSMTHLWEPTQIGGDIYKKRILALVQRKVKLGLVQAVPPVALGLSNQVPVEPSGAAPLQESQELHQRVQKNVLDLTDLLLRSLQPVKTTPAPRKARKHAAKQ